jgi:hypothetical protein
MNEVIAKTMRTVKRTLEKGIAIEDKQEYEHWRKVNTGGMMNKDHAERIFSVRFKNRCKKEIMEKERKREEEEETGI